MRGSNSLNEVCHGGLGIAGHVHQPLEVFGSPDGQHNFRVFRKKITLLVLTQ